MAEHMAERVDDIRIALRLARGDFRMDLDLRLPGSGCSVVFGPSGCGKSTLLRAIAGLEPGARGEIRPPHGPLEDAPQALDRLVPRLVAEAVVDFLEAVEVEHHQRQRPPVAVRALRFPLEVVHEGPPVVEAGQRVAVGQVERLGVAQGVGGGQRRLAGDDLQPFLGGAEAARQRRVVDVADEPDLPASPLDDRGQDRLGGVDRPSAAVGLRRRGERLRGLGAEADERGHLRQAAPQLRDDRVFQLAEIEEFRETAEENGRVEGGLQLVPRRLRTGGATNF